MASIDVYNAFIHASLAKMQHDAARARYLDATPKDLTRLVGEYREAEKVYRLAAITYFEYVLEAENE